METVNSKDCSEMEGVVELKAQLMSALEELRKSKMKNNYLEENLSKCREEQSRKQEEC